MGARREGDRGTLKNIYRYASLLVLNTCPASFKHSDK